MRIYAGIDVSVEASSVCAVDETGKIVKEAKLASEPTALIAWFKTLAQAPERIGLEAGPLSQWRYAGLREAGLNVILMETRHVRDAFRSAPVKTDRRDARGMAHLMRLGWFKPVHCKSIEAQETRALLTARSTLQQKRHDLEMSLRGILRNFGLKVGKTTPKSFEGRVRELCEGAAALQFLTEALLTARAVLETQFAELDKRLRKLARKDERVRLVMSAPGVGAVVALTYVRRSTIRRASPNPEASALISGSRPRAGIAECREKTHRARAACGRLPVPIPVDTATPASPESQEPEPPTATLRR